GRHATTSWSGAFGWKPIVTECHRYFFGIWETVSVSLRRLHLTVHILHHNRAGGLSHVQAVEAIRTGQDVMTIGRSCDCLSGVGPYPGDDELYRYRSYEDRHYLRDN